MFFAGKIIKEGALADIGCLGDVLNRRVEETVLGEELHGGTKDSLPGFLTTALSASRRGCNGRYSTISHN
jgi:hypothetical protein